MSTEKDTIRTELADIQSNMIDSYVGTIKSIVSGETPDDEVRALVVAITPNSAERTRFIYPDWHNFTQREDALSKINDILIDQDALGAVVIQHILVQDKDNDPQIPGLSFSAVAPGYKSTIFLTYEIDEDNDVSFDMFPVDFDDAVEGLTAFHKS